MENHELVDDQIYSQEHSHQPPRKIKETTGIPRDCPANGELKSHQSIQEGENFSYEFSNPKNFYY